MAKSIRINLLVCLFQRMKSLKADVKAEQAIVEAIYWNKVWHKGSNLTVKEQTDRFMKWADSLNNMLE